MTPLTRPIPIARYLSHKKIFPVRFSPYVRTDLPRPESIRTGRETAGKVGTIGTTKPNEKKNIVTLAHSLAISHSQKQISLGQSGRGLARAGLATILL